MKLDPPVRTGGDVIELLRSALLARQVTTNGAKAVGLAAHLGNVGQDLTPRGEEAMKKTKNKVCPSDPKALEFFP
jgi:hypothetical protein